MKTLLHHIERAREKPHHVRKKIAFSAALAGTALIALIWLVASASSGVFALKNNSFADSTGQSNTLTTVPENPNAGLAGAAAASRESDSAPARINIVDSATTSSKNKAPEATILPF